MNNSVQFLLPSFNWKEARLILLVIVSQLFHPLASIVGYLFLIILVIKGKEHIIKSLSLLVVLIFLNTVLFSKPDQCLIFRWLVLFSAFIKVISYNVKKTKPFPKWLIWNMIFLTSAFISSYLYSYIFLVSALKLLVFFVGVVTVEFAFLNSQNYDYGPWFFSLSTIILIISVPLIFHPLGYVRNANLFQGILSHPNTYGVYMVPYFAWISSILLQYRFHRNKFYFIFITMAIITLFLCQSRTSIFAFILALSFSFIILVNKKHVKFARMKKRIINLILLFFTGISVLYFFSPENPIIQKTVGYIIKRPVTQIKPADQNETFVGKITNSRTDLIEASFNNFKKRPLLGNGFGIQSDQNEFRPSETQAGVPYSASTEKGFLPSAILEETGFIGTIFFVIFLYWFSLPVVKKGDLPSLVLFWTSIFISFGEMVFFSIGGLGMHTLMMMSFARNLTINSPSIKNFPVRSF